MVQIGDRYGRLVVVEEVPKTHRHRRYLCRCDCGNMHEVDTHNLEHGQTKSCGCLATETRKKNAQKIGYGNLKYVGCRWCDCDKHYAKGLCKKCYQKALKEKQREVKSK